MKDRITSFKLNWHSWGLCCAEDAVQEEITIYRNTDIMVFKELNGYGVICSCEIIHIEEDKTNQFFDFLEQCCDEWQDDYWVEVCDGSVWTIRMWHSSHKVKKLSGTIAYPPHGKQIQEYIHSFIAASDSAIEPKMFGCR